MNTIFYVTLIWFIKSVNTVKSFKKIGTSTFRESINIGQRYAGIQAHLIGPGRVEVHKQTETY